MRGCNYRVCGVYSPEPRVEVCCFRLNFKISKLLSLSVPTWFCYQNLYGYSVYEHDLNASAGFGETALSIFVSKLAKFWGNLGVHSVGVDLFSHVTEHFRWVHVIYFVQRNLDRRSENYTFQIEQRWFWSKKRGYTQYAVRLQLCVRRKTRAHFVKTPTSNYK